MDEPGRREIVELMRELGSGLDKVGSTFAARNGLHPTDLAALVEVMHAEARGTPITAGELTARLGVTSGAVTGVVDRLERGGHLRRERDARDRRRVYLHHGAPGQALATAFFGPLGAASDAVMDGFTADELDVVRRFLARMVPVVRDVRPWSDEP